MVNEKIKILLTLNLSPMGLTTLEHNEKYHNDTLPAEH